MHFHAFSVLQLRISCCLQEILRPILTPIVPNESGNIVLQENRVTISAISRCQEICSSKLSKNSTGVNIGRKNTCKQQEIRNWSIGTMGVNIGRKITCKQQEIRNWSIENTLGVVYLSVY